MADLKMEEFTSNLKEYAQLRLRILQLETSARLSSAGASVGSRLVILSLLLIAFLFLNLALGLYVSHLVESYIKGFLIMGAGYAVSALFFYLFRKPLLQYPIRNKLVAAFTKE